MNYLPGRQGVSQERRRAEQATRQLAQSRNLDAPFLRFHADDGTHNSESSRSRSLEGPVLSSAIVPARRDDPVTASVVATVVAVGHLGARYE